MRFHLRTHLAAASRPTMRGVRDMWGEHGIPGMTMRFSAAVEQVLEHEGLLSNDPRDPGGITNFGISLRWLKSIGTILGDIDKDGDVDAHDVAAPSRTQAKELYWLKFWRLE